MFHRRLILKLVSVYLAITLRNNFVFNTAETVNGATILIRDRKTRSITATVSTAALQPGWIYSIWWAVFNHPEHCALPYRCSVADLEINGGDPAIKASVFWGGGLIADADGVATTSLRLGVGKTSRELFANSRDYGLRNLLGAELHLVLRSHGQAGFWGTVAQQLGTANDACPPQGCVNDFVSFHPPRD